MSAVVTNTLAPTVSDRDARVMAPVVVLDAAGATTLAASKDVLRDAAADIPVVVAVPAWFGMADRHRLVIDLDPGRTRSVSLVSSTLAGACGRFEAMTREGSSSTVLCLDVRYGWSAGLVRFTPDGAAELASWAVAPHELTGMLHDDAAAAATVDAVLNAAAAVAGGDTVHSVLVIDDIGRHAALIGDVVRRSGRWARCDVVVVDAWPVMHGAASLVQRPDHGRHSVGALTYSLMVRADDDPEQPTMHVVAARHAPFPSTTRLTFALGPDDGAPLHFDVFEQSRSIADDQTVEQQADHRVVLRAHLVRERGFDQNMVVTFDLGTDGQLSIGPTKAWRLEWQPGSSAIDALL